MAWLFLIIAGMLEVGFASLLNLSEGFKRPWPTVGFLFLGLLSLGFLNFALSFKTVPLGTAYAVWTGIGALGTAVVGMVFFRDPVTFWRLVFLTMLLISVCGLNYVSEH